MARISLVILILIGLGSCGAPKDGIRGVQTRDFESEYSTIPERWRTGDSIKIRIALVSRDDDYEPGQPEIFMPLIHNARFEFGKSMISIAWKPDSLNYLPESERIIRIKGFFDSRSDSSYIKYTERLIILQDSLGYYYFQRDENSYKTDTFKLE
jgi:hypothetical protein